MPGSAAGTARSSEGSADVSGDIHAGALIAHRFRLFALAGTGGGGAVWKAYDEALDRAVALKQATCSYGSGCPDRGRSLQEARTAARLNHPGTITIHDILTERERVWIVMELIEGESLQAAIDREGGLPAERVAEIGLQVLDALDAAHAAGLIHCDVKPSNVLLHEDGRAVLTDFGLAVRRCRRTTVPCVGSPPYISPEQALGRPVTEASDLWGLGTTLYAAVEGRSPYQRDEPLASLLAVVTDDGRPFAAGPLGPVIERLLRKDPADRATPDEIAPLLARVARRRKRRGSHRRRRSLDGRAADVVT